MKDYSLGIILALLFIVSLIVQIYSQIQLGEEFWEIVKATFENWQSEFLQLLTFVVLTTYFIYKGSHESKDSQERFEKKVSERFDRIEKELTWFKTHDRTK